MRSGKQKQASPLPADIQILLIYSGMKGYLDKLTIEQVVLFKSFLIEYIKNSNILKKFIITDKINHKVFSIFFSKAIEAFSVSCK